MCTVWPYRSSVWGFTTKANQALRYLSTHRWVGHRNPRGNVGIYMYGTWTSTQQLAGSNPPRFWLFPQQTCGVKRKLHYFDLLCICCTTCHNYRAMYYIVQSAVGIEIACRLSFCPSVTLVDHQDHISWKSWKLIARTISPTPSLFVAQRPSTYCQGNMGKFGGD